MSEQQTIITIKDVAARAGVSVATVSRVLSDKDNVRGALRDRVIAAADALSYRPNRMARNFRAQRSKFIGLIISDVQNPFYTSLVRAVEDAAYADQFSLMLCNSDESPDKERLYIDFLRDERVAGVIASPTNESETSLKALIDARIPVVAVDRRAPLTPVDTVLLDHETSAYMLVKHLLDYGHRRIGAIIPAAVSTSGIERRRGYERALAEMEIPLEASLMRFVEPTEAMGNAATFDLLSQPNPPTALFAGNNLTTIGALKAIRQSRLRIPKDISLVGHDDLPWMSLLDPPITVSAQPIYEMGQQAMAMLMARINGANHPVREIKLSSTLIRRESVEAPASPSAPSRVTHPQG
jgi:DNA-binding LacI/PurR family transcriptional regulator